MPKKPRLYAPEFRQRIVELFRQGRSAEELARQFEPSAQAIRNWAKQADRDEGKRAEGLTSLEQEELRRLRRDNRVLREEQFAVTARDQLWVADITYVPTWAGFLYLAVVLDAWSRRVVDWAMETHLRTGLVLAALNMAVAQRQPMNVIHHSDQGCQYTSLAFGSRCREAGIRSSMGSVGDAYDNALCESFFATLECELLNQLRFATPAAARLAVIDFNRGLVQPSAPRSNTSHRSRMKRVNCPRRDP